MESFNANFNCRFCKIDKISSQTQTRPNTSLFRSIEIYEHDVNLNEFKSTGLKERCIFNCLDNFHAAENYYADIMHDLYEGVCHYDMLNILRYLLYDAQYFSLYTLNNRLEMFSFPDEGSNRPPNLSRDFHLKTKISMSASETIAFVRYFGLIVGDLVPKNDNVWKFYILLRELVDLINTSYVDDNLMAKLDFYVTRHNSMYQELFKDKLKPKHHHLLHYATIMKHIGPVKNLSCMRYEAKHRLSKMTANVSCSRKNIPKTLSIKHQLKSLPQAYY